MPLPLFTGDTYKDRQEFYKELLSRIRHSSEAHRGWYTHKNPYGCWICDLLLMCETLLTYLDQDIDGHPNNNQVT